MTKTIKAKIHNYNYFIVAEDKITKNIREVPIYLDPKDEIKEKDICELGAVAFKHLVDLLT